MHTEHKIEVEVPRQRLWQFLMDVPVMATCIPGVESVEALDDNAYKGKLKVSVGPISTRFDGRVDVVETDDLAFHASLKASGSDNRLASRVNAHMTMALNEISSSASEIVIHTDLAIIGKLGEFGQPFLGRKANDLMKEFSARLRKKLESQEPRIESPVL